MGTFLVLLLGFITGQLSGNKCEREKLKLQIEYNSLVVKFLEIQEKIRLENERNGYINLSKTIINRD